MGASPGQSGPLMPAPAAAPLGKDLWKAAVDAVRNESPRHGKSLAFGRLLRAAAGEVVIAFTPEADFHRATVSGSGRPLIEEIFAKVFGRPTKLIIDQHGAASAPPSLAEEEAKEKEAHEKSVEARVRRHPALQAAMRMLGGEIEQIQMLERARPSAINADLPEGEPVEDSP